VDAIAGARKQMHTVIAELCTGCDLCLPPCPVDASICAGPDADGTSPGGRRPRPPPAQARARLDRDRTTRAAAPAHSADRHRGTAPKRSAPRSPLRWSGRARAAPRTASDEPGEAPRDLRPARGRQSGAEDRARVPDALRAARLGDPLGPGHRQERQPRNPRAVQGLRYAAADGRARNGGADRLHQDDRSLPEQAKNVVG
jgi:electron transport complex protein RnfB